ncbi:MAG TPA: hypothetical protein VGG05_12250 [Pseudonocardiaceae bacterium]
MDDVALEAREFTRLLFEVEVFGEGPPDEVVVRAAQDTLAAALLGGVDHVLDQFGRGAVELQRGSHPQRFGAAAVLHPGHRARTAQQFVRGPFHRQAGLFPPPAQRARQPAAVHRAECAHRPATHVCAPFV